VRSAATSRRHSGGHVAPGSMWTRLPSVMVIGTRVEGIPSRGRKSSSGGSAP
jgi:hypothetical protein